MTFRNAAILTLLFAISMTTVFLLSPPTRSLAATSYVLSATDPVVSTTCASLGGTWDGQQTCTLNTSLTLNSGDSILVDPGAVLAISGGVTVSNNGALEDYGTITNDAGGFVDNSGAITAFVANGTILNYGSITNNPDGSIAIEHPQQAPPLAGSFNFTNAGTFSNQGSFVNFGNFTNAPGATVSNSGSFRIESTTTNAGGFSAPLTLNDGNFTNLAHGTITVGGPTINNTGLFTNIGTIAEEPNLFSKINNLGTIVSNGTITNVGYFVNLGSITNSGVIDILVVCSGPSCGSFANSGILTNAPQGNITNQGNYGNFNGNPRRPQLGTLVNEGKFTNSRVFVNALGGTTTNTGVINNTGSFTNLDSISNSGLIQSSGVLQNSANISNNVTGVIINARTITNSGSIVNSGAITDDCGGVIYGLGTISGNPVASASCTSSTTSTPVPEFPAEMLLPVTLSMLILVTFLTRKGLGTRLRR